MFQNNVQLTISLPSHQNVGDYNFKIFKIVKTIVINYNFRLTDKIVVDDYSFKNN